jgi:translation initiation factor 2B subunit (eIF-2B alpha/beta/delta family)
MTTFDVAILQIINDKQSGSVAVLQQLIRGISAYLIREDNSTKSISTIQNRFPLLKGALGHFAVVDHFLNHLKSVLDNENSSDELFNFVNDYNNRWKNANTEVANIAMDKLNCEGKTILLHSNSSVITSFFHKLQKKQVKLRVIQTESRPENEGRYQAKMLADLGFQVSFIVDAAVGFMMDKVDMVLLGADQIHKNYFVNKIGTLSIAMLSKQQNTPLYVLADSRKIASTEANPQSLHNINKPGTDIWDTNNDLIEPINYYFEAIPTRLVTGFITETRILKADEL